MITDVLATFARNFNLLKHYIELKEKEKIFPDELNDYLQQTLESFFNAILEDGSVDQVSYWDYLPTQKVSKHICDLYNTIWADDFTLLEKILALKPNKAIEQCVFEKTSVPSCDLN